LGFISCYAFKIHALKPDRLEACPTFGGLNAIRLISGLRDFFVRIIVISTYIEK
jgi:hypothetical protein